jgi:hypothetical protein
MTTMRCPQCGSTFERGAAEFCPNPNCGYPVSFADEGRDEAQSEQIEMVRQPGEKVGAQPVPAVSTTPPPPTEELPATLPEADTASPEMPSIPPSDQRRRAAIIAGALVAVLALGGGIFFLLTRGGAEPEFTADEEVAEQVEAPGAVVERIDPSTIAASASSELAPDFVAANTIDDDLETAWSDGVDGPGIGETLTYTFTEPIRLVRVEVVNGHERPPDVGFDANARVQDATLATDAGSVRITLDDSFDVQGTTLDFGTTDSFTLRVDSVYPGTEFDEVALTDVAFYAARAGE